MPRRFKPRNVHILRAGDSIRDFPCRILAAKKYLANGMGRTWVLKVWELGVGTINTRMVHILRADDSIMDFSGRDLAAKVPGKGDGSHMGVKSQ